MKMTVTIEKQSDGTYIAYNTEENESSLIGTGATVSEAKDDFFNSIQEVIETLYYKGLDTTLVESLLIGYQWKNLEDTGVVDLIPNWYIKYDNQWYRYEALFQLLAEEEEEAPNGF